MEQLVENHRYNTSAKMAIYPDTIKQINNIDIVSNIYPIIFNN